MRVLQAFTRQFVVNLTRYLAKGHAFNLPVSTKRSRRNIQHGSMKMKLRRKCVD